MNDLRLKTPEQFDFDNPLVELNPKKIAKTLRDLPLLNLVASVRQLFGALQPLNQQHVDDRDRLRLLELYREPVDGIFGAFDNSTLRQQPISPTQRTKLKDDVERLIAELANGYKIVVRSAHEEGAAARDNADLPAAVYRALQQTVHVLVHAFRMYRPVPPSTLLEMHQLFLYARHLGIADAEIAGTRDGDADARSVGALYRQALMLIVSDPLRMADGDAFRLYQLLPHLLASVQSGAAPAGELPSGCYLIEPDADEPPRPAGRVSSGGAGPNAFTLDLRAVPAAMRAYIDGLKRAGRKTEAEERARLLQLLLAHIETAPVRREVRRPAGRMMDLVVGVESVHRFLSFGAVQGAWLRPGAGHGIEVEGEGGGEESGGAVVPESWAVVNESAQGCMLRSTERDPTSLRVGEILGLIDLPAGAGQAQLTCAVVRWMRAGADQALEIGVEMLAGTPMPVRCQATDAQSLDTLTRNCVFFPSVATLGLSATLLTPKRLYARDRTLRLEVGGNTMSVIAGHLVMDTACFDRFEFSTAAQDN